MATAKMKATPKKADAPAAGNTLGTSMGYDSAASAKREQDYQTQSDVRTLHDAHQIRKDPERHGRAKKHVMEMLSAMKGGGIPKVPQMAGNAGDAAGPDSELPQS